MLQFFEALELVWDLVLQECGLRVLVLAKEENNDSEQESVYYASWKRVDFSDSVVLFIVLDKGKNGAWPV